MTSLHEGQSCANCYYYTNGSHESGRCQVTEPDSNASWPSVRPDDWCGDWSADGAPKWRGEPGPKGDPGLPGEKGDRGDIGPPGPAGVLGLQSFTGQTDANGELGWTYPTPFALAPIVWAEIIDASQTWYMHRITSATETGCAISIQPPDSGITVQLAAIPQPENA